MTTARIRSAPSRVLALAFVAFVMAQFVGPPPGETTTLMSLERIHERIQQALASLQTGSAEEREQAARLLGRHASVAPDNAVLLLAGVLTGDPEHDVRCQAARALEKFGPAARSAIPAMMEALTNLTPCVRLEVAFALASVASPGDVEADRLLDAFQASSGEARVAVAFALATLKPRVASTELQQEQLAKCARRFLEKSLDASSGLEAQHWGRAVAQLNSETAAQLIPWLVEVAEAQQSSRGANAGYALKAMGLQAPMLIEMLVDEARSESLEERVEAINALGHFGPAAEPATSFLAQSLGSPNRNLQLAAAKSLQRLGVVAKDAAHELAEIARNSEGKLLRATVMALIHVDPEKAEKLLPWLRETHPELALEASKELIRLML